MLKISSVFCQHLMRPKIDFKFVHFNQNFIVISLQYTGFSIYSSGHYYSNFLKYFIFWTFGLLIKSLLIKH